MGSTIHPNTEMIFGKAEKPEREIKLRGSGAALAVMLVLAGALVFCGALLFLVSDSDAHTVGFFMLGAAVICAIAAPFVSAPKITLLPEGFRLKKLGREEEIPYTDAVWFETQGVEKVTLYLADRKVEYVGKDHLALMGALRGWGVPGIDPDDMLPGGLGEKRYAGRKTAAIALMAAAAVIWAELLIPGIPGEAVWILSIFFAALTITFGVIAFCMLRQKVELYEDGFYLTSAVGGRKFFRYDEIVGRVVKKQAASQYGGTLITVTLVSRDGRKAKIPHALLCPELLELADYDSLRFMDGEI